MPVLGYNLPRRSIKENVLSQSPSFTFLHFICMKRERLHDVNGKMKSAMKCVLNGCTVCFFLCPCVCVLLEGRRKSETPLGTHDPRTAVQLRTALKRLKEIMEGKSQVSTIPFHNHTAAVVYCTSHYTPLL